MFLTDHPWPLFNIFSVFSNTSTILQQKTVKIIHLVKGVGIRTHDLLIISLQLKPLDQFAIFAHIVYALLCLTL